MKPAAMPCQSSSVSGMRTDVELAARAFQAVDRASRVPCLGRFTGGSCAGLVELIPGSVPAATTHDVCAAVVVDRPSSSAVVGFRRRVPTSRTGGLRRSLWLSSSDAGRRCRESSGVGFVGVHDVSVVGVVSVLSAVSVASVAVVVARCAARHGSPDCCPRPDSCDPHSATS